MIPRKALLSGQFDFADGALRHNGRCWTYIEAAPAEPSIIHQRVAAGDASVSPPQRNVAAADTDGPRPRRRKPSEVEQIADWLVSRGRGYFDARSRDEMAADFRAAFSLKKTPSVRNIDRAKASALERLETRQTAPIRAK
jgi:hypothetical protein